LDVTLVFWSAVLLAGIAAIQWGAQRLSSLLDVLRLRFGLAETACGALLAIGTASPEISINVAAVAFGWPGIGLGTALGSNVPALPLMMTVGYASMRWHTATNRRRGKPPPTPFGHGDPALQLKSQSVFVQALPYLGMLALVAVLTLPPRWAGLQPVDAAILLVAALAYMAQALLRKRGEPDARRQVGRPLAIALLGVVVIGIGAVAAVQATNVLGDLLGLSPLVAGLFITGLLCALPESAAAWPLARDGRATTTASTTIADGTLSVSLAFVPLAMADAPIGDTALYAVNLAAVFVLVGLYVFVNRRKPTGYATGGEVLLIDLAYLLYLAIVLTLLVKAPAAA
jgi:cation:H+ antiporter